MKLHHRQHDKKTFKRAVETPELHVWTSRLIGEEDPEWVPSMENGAKTGIRFCTNFVT